ncbi:hypothetical protein QF032_002655 [Streptomyces achromogenes]|nr:hypothetical protein [Streptomyces achromogenes]
MDRQLLSGTDLVLHRLWPGPHMVRPPGALRHFTDYAQLRPIWWPVVLDHLVEPWVSLKANYVNRLTDFPVV